MSEAISHVRVMGDPLEVQSKRFGATLRSAQTKVADLESTLRELDDLTEKLSEHGMTIAWTLGVVGDAAAAARRDMVPVDRPRFEMPRGA